MFYSTIVIFHGAIVLFLGMLFGFPYGRKLASRKSTPQEKEAWKLAHSSIIGGGVMLIAFGAAFPTIGLDVASSMCLAQAITYATVISAYAFVVGTLVAAISGHRGLRVKGPLANQIAFTAYVIAVLGSLIGGALFIWAAYKALLS